MKILNVIGERGPMPLCKSGACPAAVLVASGHVYIQGYLPPAAETKELAPPAGEGFVTMPLETFERIATQVLQQPK